jgi:TRAP transporter 4TM/12TM fusion protein
MIFIPIGVLIFLLFIVQWSLMKVGFWSIIATVLASLFRKETRLNAMKALRTCESATRGILEVAAVCACAGIISCVLMMTGLGLRLSGFLVTLAGGHLLVLLVFCMIASIIFGMGLPTTAVYIITAVLLAPAITGLGVKPMAAHLFVFYFGILSAITPPVCLAAYAGAGIAGSDPMKTGYTAWRLGLSAFIVPYFFIYNPFLLLQGGWFDIMINVVTAAIGVAAIAVAGEGFLLRPMALFLRAIMLGGGILLISSSITNSLLGILLVCIILFWQYIQKTRDKRP